MNPAYQRAKPDQTGGRHAERVRHVDRAQIRTRGGELREAGIRRQRTVRDREAAQMWTDGGGGGDEHRVEELCELKEIERRANSK